MADAQLASALRRIEALEAEKRETALQQALEKERRGRQSETQALRAAMSLLA